MNTPRVSIIISTYNRATMLPASIESLLAQDYPGKEIIVVDDGSTDQTAEVCKKYPVRYLWRENQGASAARNFAVTQCAGELLIFQDDDDLCPAGSVRERAEAWRADPACAFILGKMRRFMLGAEGTPDFIDPEEGIRQLCLGASIVKRSVYEELGGLDESFQMGDGEDLDFWQRLHEAGHAHRLIDRVCLHYRRHAGNSTHDKNMVKHAILKTLHSSLLRSRKRGNAQQATGIPHDQQS